MTFLNRHRLQIATLLGAAVLTVGRPSPAGAQTTSSISGTVTSVGGRPLAAAQIYIHGTGLGVLTRDSGQYLLLGVPAGDAELRVETVGHQAVTRTVTVPEGGSVTADFTLQYRAIALDEIVVTGAGRETERRKLGNTVATVSAAERVGAPITNLSELIQAQEPSVVGLISGGTTGSGTRLRIRGSNSLTMSNEPLVYVDGIRVDNSGDLGRNGRGGDTGSRLDDINWEAVERIEILKGAAAATLYGSEASSGVIQIFTRSGRPGEARFNVRAEGGIIDSPDVVDPNAGFARDDAQAAYLSELFGEPLAPFEVFERDFFGDLMERGNLGSLSVDVAGGRDDVQYYVSGRVHREDGPLGVDDLAAARDVVRRVHANASVTFLPRKRLSLRVTGSLADVSLQTYEWGNNVGSGVFGVVFAKPERAHCFPSAIAVGRTYGSATPQCTGPGNPWGSPGFGTPRELMNTDWRAHTRHFTSTASLSWSNPSGVSFEALLGMDQVDERSTFVVPFGWAVDGISSQNRPPQGVRSIGDRSHRELTTDLRAGWSALLGRGYTSDLTVGGQAFFTDDSWHSGFGAQFPAPGIQSIDAGQFVGAEDALASKVGLGVYAQEQFGYDEWLFATLGARFDETSAFGREAGSAFYPKASVSAVLSELEAFEWSWLTTLRARAAFGRSGLQPGAFDRFTTYATVPSVFGGAIEPLNLGNPELKPEVATEWEVGLETELFDGRVGLDVTGWDRSTRDALIERSYPAAGGFGAGLANIGRLDAHGLEVKVNGLVFDRPRVSVRLFGNAAYLSETITDMGGAPTIAVSGTYARHRNALVEGYAPSSLFGAQLIPTCAPGIARRCYTPGTTVPFDTDGDGVPDTMSDFRAWLASMPSISLSNPLMGPLMDDADGDGDLLDHHLGKPTPDWQGSFGADVTLWGRLHVASLFEYRAGNYSVSNLMDAFRNSHPAGRNNRRAAVVESTLLDPATQGDPARRYEAAMAWANDLVSLAPYSGVNLVEAGDFVRWRELTVSLRLPARWAGWLRAQGASVAVSGRNLAVWTRYGGTDPESNELARCGGSGEATLQCNFLEGVDMATMPVPRRFTMHLRLGF